MSVLSQQEQEFEQDAMLEEDRRLRQLGHPQSHIYMFRSADLTYDTIAQLPLPWYDIRGIIPDEYWSLLQDYGIPSSDKL